MQRYEKDLNLIALCGIIYQFLYILLQSWLPVGVGAVYIDDSSHKISSATNTTSDWMLMRYEDLTLIIRLQKGLD